MATQQVLSKKEILEWDVVNWGRALDFWEQKLANTSRLNCLELGANKGGLSLWLASIGHQVICSDIYPVNKDVLLFHQKFSYHKNITYEIINANQIPYVDFFDVIIFKSVLGGVGRGNNKEDIEKAFLQIYKSLKPGGILLFAENLRGSKLHVFFRKKFIEWANDWNYVAKKDLIGYLQHFSKFEMRTTGFLGAFGFNESVKKIFGHIDRGLSFVLPSNWQYIIYGYAKK